MRSALPPKLAAALGEKPRAHAAPGPESTTQVRRLLSWLVWVYFSQLLERDGEKKGGGDFSCWVLCWSRAQLKWDGEKKG